MPRPMMTVLLPRSDALVIIEALRVYIERTKDNEERRAALLIRTLLRAHVAVDRANEALDTKDR